MGIQLANGMADGERGKENPEPEPYTLYPIPYTLTLHVKTQLSRRSTFHSGNDLYRTGSFVRYSLDTCCCWLVCTGWLHLLTYSYLFTLLL